DSGSRDLVEKALTFTSREHVNTIIECGLSHGDFAPWNTRISAAGLAVFDWEAAESGKPCAWDALHFEAQTASLLRTRQRSLTTDWSANPAALLYLIHSSARLLLEQGVLGRDVEWRLRQLRRQGGRHAH
ncbi:MAG TPA: hypothetical protein VFA04_08550, partial [Bryobacteraceae bacterium]|nr:hypothetical protein [Bryobacteraceae bacterium]